MKPHHVTIEHTLPDGTEIRVIGNVTGGSPGNYSGPPERCYEAEPPEAEIERVFTVDEDGNEHDFDYSLWNDELISVHDALVEQAERDRDEQT